MPLDIDPIYHTETMVKILREQGHSQLAMELAETILRQKGFNEKVARLLEELKEEARAAFQRFKKSGRPAEREEPSENAEETVPSEAMAEPGIVETEIALTGESPAAREGVRLTLVPDREVKEIPKIKRLERLLARIQERRNHETR